MNYFCSAFSRPSRGLPLKKEWRYGWSSSKCFMLQSLRPERLWRHFKKLYLTSCPAMQWQIVQGVPCLHPWTAGRGPSRPQRLLSAGGSRCRRWMDGYLTSCLLFWLFKNVKKKKKTLQCFAFFLRNIHSLPVSFTEVKVHVIFLMNRKHKGGVFVANVAQFLFFVF